MQGSAGRAGTALSLRGVCLGLSGPGGPGRWGFGKICGNRGRGCGERFLLTSQCQPPAPFYTPGSLAWTCWQLPGTTWGRGCVGGVL